MNQSAELDVFGVGNAMVDILAMVGDDFIREHDLPRGGMLLVDSEKQGRLLRELDHASLEMQSGGSAANTIISVALSGGTGFYTGKVARDPNGEFYRQDMVAAGIHFDVTPAPEDSGPTGSCLVLTTPDAERTMCTHLGVSIELADTDIDVDQLGRCKLAYIEGYLWDAPGPRQACIKAMEQANRLGVKTAFTFSDPFLVDRFPEDFRRVVHDYCDILFCNAEEAKQLMEIESLEKATELLGHRAELVFVTDGANGCLVSYQGEVKRIDGFKVDAIDTVGAGDAFAGGVLFGLANGYEPQRAARWGNYLASRVVTIHGARYPEPLANQISSILDS
ncbi:MAG: adenosine kinase [Planctomycetaceae bacterium]|nr:adenosine kinase [Planctomycetaceae bacterium]